MKKISIFILLLVCVISFSSCTKVLPDQPNEDIYNAKDYALSVFKETMPEDFVPVSVNAKAEDASGDSIYYIKITYIIGDREENFTRDYKISVDGSVCTILEETQSVSSGYQTQEGTYSFYGENEYFSLSDGSIVVNGKTETFDGGVLKAVNPEFFSDVKSFSASFYTIKSNGEQDEFMNHKKYSSDGTPISFGGGLGGSSSNSPDLIRKIEQGGLWLEVQTVDTADKETVYQMELTVTKVHN